MTAAYDHRCALCGIRIVTPDGHTVVEWEKEAPEALTVRNLYLSDKSDRSDLSYKSAQSSQSDIYAFRTSSAEIAANTLICLINQASSLLG